MPDKIRTIIVDDEPLAIEALLTLLKKIDLIDVIRTCHNSFDAFSFIKENEVDLLFLDISMPEMSGLDLLKSLTNPPPVIMTTAHREFAVEAFDLEVLDYLLKPISADRLMKAVSRFLERQPNLSNTITSEENFKEEKENSLFVRADRRFKKIDFDSIIYIEGLKDYIKIHTLDDMILTRMPMKEIQEKLPSKQFLRIHRSYIINKEKVTAITNYDVELGDSEIPIGNSYKEIVDQLMGQPDDQD